MRLPIIHIENKNIEKPAIDDKDNEERYNNVWVLINKARKQLDGNASFISEKVYHELEAILVMCINHAERFKEFHNAYRSNSEGETLNSEEQENAFYDAAVEKSLEIQLAHDNLVINIRKYLRSLDVK